MMDPKMNGIYGSHSDLSYFHYQANYMRNSRAIGVLWGVFTMCFAIINVVVFVQPQWLGDTETSKGTGYFGLWKSCRLLQDGQDLICEGRLDDFSSIVAPAFRAATVFMALSVVLTILCLLSMLQFCFLHSSTVFHICGWLQAACALCMLVAVLIFPAGWDAPVVREVCGPEADNYGSGQCGIRWAYILAMIGVVDCGVLSILAFVLGTRYVKHMPEQYMVPNGSLYKGPPGLEIERFSEYSHRTGRSQNGKGHHMHPHGPPGPLPIPTGGFHPPTHFSVNNFQL